MKNIASKFLSSVVMFVMVFSSFGFTVTASAATDNNPSLGGACGLDIALVMDESTSIQDGDFALMQGAMVDFVEALRNTPTEFALVDFGTEAHLRSGFTSDADTVEGQINNPRLSGTQYTNWEQALAEAQGLFPSRASKPDLIVFASDGNPNKYGSPVTPSGNGQDEPNALAAAVTVADAIKNSPNFVRVLPIAIGNDISVANLESISGTGDVVESNFEQLATDLGALAKELCGGTITATKIIDRDGDLETTDDQSGAAEWTFNINGTEYSTDSEGKTEAVIIDDPSTSVAEVAQSGYQFVDAVCKDQDDNVVGTLDAQDMTVNDITLENEDDFISCVFYNQPGGASLTVVKNVVNDSETGTSSAPDFTLNVAMAVDSQANPFDTESFPGNEEGTVAVLPGDTYYVVTEENPGNYSVSYSEGCSGLIGVDGQITCTVTNNDLPPEVGSLTVVKVVVNDDQGTSAVVDFPLFVTAGDVATPVTSGAANILSPGSYVVSETNNPEAYTSSFSGDCDANGNVSLATGESKTCVITNNDVPAEVVDACPNEQTDPGVQTSVDQCTPPPVDETDVCPNIAGNQATVPHGKHKNGRGDCVSNSSGGGGSVGGGSSVPTGQVLGAETQLCHWDVNTYMRKGYKNDASQVKILQNDLLNGYMHSTLVVDGIFGPKTEAAVKAFQVAKKDKILIPWNLTLPTGIFYKTTLVEAKNTICPEVILPIPSDLVPWSANAAQVPAPAH